jgi:hypothetical protein
LADLYLALEFRFSALCKLNAVAHNYGKLVDFSRRRFGAGRTAFVGSLPGRFLLLLCHVAALSSFAKGNFTDVDALAQRHFDHLAFSFVTNLDYIATRGLLQSIEFEIAVVVGRSCG